MAKQPKLTKNLTEEELTKGYWYTDKIKAFAKEMGIANSSKLRKDELEQLIKQYTRTGQVKKDNRKNIIKPGTKDIDKGLKPSITIILCDLFYFCLNSSRVSFESRRKLISTRAKQPNLTL